MIQVCSAFITSVDKLLSIFYSFTAYSNSLKVIHKLMHFQYNNILVKIIESPTCPCVTTEQTIDHLIFQCELLGKERDKLISGVSKTDNWPLSKNRLISEHFKSFSKFIHEISLEKLNEI